MPRSSLGTCLATCTCIEGLFLRETNRNARTNRRRNVSTCAGLLLNHFYQSSGNNDSQLRAQLLLWANTRKTMDDLSRDSLNGQGALYEKRSLQGVD